MGGIKKRFYLYNTLLLILAVGIFSFYKQQGYFMSVIMRQDIIYYSIIFPVYMSLLIFGISYKIWTIKKVDSKFLLIFKVFSMIVTLYISLLLFTSTRIHLTTVPMFENWLLIIAGILIIVQWAIVIAVNKGMLKLSK